MLAQKGGSGKTTTAVHLAVEASRDKMKVALVDLDPQRSASIWHKNREKEEPRLASILSVELEELIEAATKDGVDLLIVDTPPHTAPATAKVAQLSHFVLVPCQPSPLDIAALPPTIELIKAAKCDAAAVLTRTTYRSLDTADTKAALQTYGIRVSPITMGDRNVYRRALMQGEAVCEFDPKGKASEEVSNLWSWLKGEVF